MNITKESWEERISKLKGKEKCSDAPRGELIQELARRIEETILNQAKHALSQGKIGVLFSGGVDSTLIAFILLKNNIPFEAVTIGFRDNDDQKLPEDIQEAREIAKSLGFISVEKIYNFSEIEELFTQTIHILGEHLANVVNVGVGSVELAGIIQLQQLDSEITQIFGGLGSEEIFAGYQRHKDSQDKHEECWNGLFSMYERDLLRDFSLAEVKGIEFWTPFLDETLISFAMNIPVEFKIDEVQSKIILREASVVLGLSEKYANRPKRAAQYGSRTDKALEKLAKQNGYKYKKDYVRYILKK